MFRQFARIFRTARSRREWGNGGMGNARWSGVRLSDVLNKAGVKSGAVAARFTGLDEPAVSDGPPIQEIPRIEHARRSDVIIAYAMNGKPLPLLNGYPIRLVVPGWYSTYWIKMLSDIELLDAPDDNYWMKTAYLIPDTEHAEINRPGRRDDGADQPHGAAFLRHQPAGGCADQGACAGKLRGLAMGGDCGVAKVEISGDGGQTWPTRNWGKTKALTVSAFGRRSYRPGSGPNRFAVRCTNTKGEVQPDSRTGIRPAYAQCGRTPVRDGGLICAR